MGIREFLEKVAVKRFEDEPVKQQVKSSNNGFSIACPYCGDSKKRPGNYRGNVYENTKAFKCFNDGCFKWTTMAAFVSEWSAKLSIDISDLNFDFEPELVLDSVRNKIETDIGKNAVAEYVRSEGIINQLPETGDFVYRFGLRHLSEAEPGSNVHRVFVEERNLLNSYNTSCLYFDDFDDKLYILNEDASAGRTLSMYIRNIDPKKVEKRRYDAFTFSRMIERFGIHGAHCDVELLDALGHYFNIMNADAKSTVSVTEGQIDSLFVRNSVAATGLSKLSLLMDFFDWRCIRMIFDNDSAGKVEAVKNISRGYHTFLWASLKERLANAYPHKRRKINGIKDVNDLYNFVSHSKAVDLSRFNVVLDHYFSNEPMDMAFV